MNYTVHTTPTKHIAIMQSDAGDWLVCEKLCAFRFCGMRRNGQYLPPGVVLVRPYLMEHCSSSATALITDTQTVCSRRHCLRDCHRTHLSDSSLFVHFEVSVYYYYNIIIGRQQFLSVSE